MHIGSNRELFVDDYLLNVNETTVEFQVHHPVCRESVLTRDAPYEGSMSNYHNLFYDDGLYRMYYLGWEFGRPGIVVCYAQSRDGIHFEKPELGICEYNGSKANNIIWDSAAHSVGSGAENVSIDNFMVFRDDNPNCEKDKRYKAIARRDHLVDGKPQISLRSFYSADAIHFVPGHIIADNGAYDSLNVAFWDGQSGKYRCYFRHFHKRGQLPKRWIGKPAELIRYTLRRDGFVSMHAGAKERKVVTKEFTYTGEKLFANLETSAWGYAFFALVDREGNHYESCEYFGNSTDKEIVLPGDTVKALSGKPVKLEVRLRDADLYAIRFSSN